MSERPPADLGTTIAGVRLPFVAMNASGVSSTTAAELRALARSETGAIVLRTATLHPLVHPAYRSLQNPGAAAYLPLVRELADAGTRPVIPSIAGATVDEYAILARTFADAGAALIEANVADEWVAATLAPFEDARTLGALAARLASDCPVPVSLKFPPRFAASYRKLGPVLADAGIGVIVIQNDFAGFEKFLLESGGRFEMIVFGGIRSGYDVRRALGKGAKAVQVGSALAAEGPGLFARLAREMRMARSS